MPPPPTRLERLIGVRIEMKLWGRWIGTGHVIRQRRRRGQEDTDVDSSDSDSD